MKSISLILVSASLLLLAGCATSPAPARAGERLTTQAISDEPVLYDVVPNGGVLKAIGQNVRVGTPSTTVTLSARVASATPLVADAAVFGVRREGTENHDIGWTDNYAIGSAEQTFTASGQFPAGNYTFWFAYLKDGVWHETNKRAFTIAESGIPAVPLDPVDPSENAGPLNFLGTDTRSGFKNAAVRFSAKLSSPTPIPLDRDYEPYGPLLSFTVRDAAGNNFDTRTHLTIPATIGSDTTLTATGYFPEGTYRYWVSYRQNGQWHDLGDARTFTIAPTPVAPAPPEGSWALNPALSDEFENGFDPAKWVKDIAYDHSGVLGFKPENAYVEGGNLVLAAKKETVTVGGQTYDYSAGAVQSLFDVPGQPSYVEVRAKVLSSKANVLSAIWLQTLMTTQLKNPNPEIDLQETFGYRDLVSTLHTWSNFPDHYEHDQLASNRFPTGVSDISEDYHLYGLERRDGWLRFYFDGKLAWAIKPDVPEMATMGRHVVLSLEGHLGQPNDAGLPGQFLIDYVRTYTPAP